MGVRAPHPPDWAAARAVFITGCDSGLGFSLAHHCLQAGLVVIAGCHTAHSAAGADSLERLAGESGRLFVTRQLDVADLTSLTRARATVEQALAATNSQLWAVVNNAAVLVLAKLEWQLDSMMEDQLRVNLLGPLRVARVFLPLLRRNPGSRIINITSPCAETRLPLAGLYAASKAGLEAASDSLRAEEGPVGVSVVLLDPGDILAHTPLASRQAEHYAAMERARAGKEAGPDEETFRLFSHRFSQHLPRPGLGVIQQAPRLYR